MITSLYNDKIKQAVKLRDKQYREETDLYIIEGYRELFFAQQSNRPIKEIFYCKELFLKENEWSLMKSFKGVELTEVAKEPFIKIAYRDRPEGLLAIGVQQKQSLEELDKKLSLIKCPFLVIAESIEKPGNLGSILRSCDATNVDALIVVDQCTDIHNPNVLRSSVGAFFTVPIFEATSQEVLKLLRKHKIHLLATTPHTEHEYDRIDLTKGVALILGREQVGLSDFWLNEANLKIKIPMLGKIDSLNVSSAATVVLYEVVRQRRHGYSI